MKAVMLSLRPQWCEKIFNGSKSIEVRKSRPSIPTPFKVYVYQTKHKGGKAIVSEVLNSVYGGGKVIGSFVCDKIISTCGWRLKGHTGRCAKRTKSEEEFPKNACLSIEEIVEYSGNENLEIYGWHITEPKLFEKPRDITEFSRYGYQEIKSNGTGYFCGNTKCKYCNPAEVIAGLYIPSICKKNGCSLKRPPESWCYIEEEDNER